jgi:hypothetical protein
LGLVEIARQQVVAAAADYIVKPRTDGLPTAVRFVRFGIFLFLLQKYTNVLKFIRFDHQPGDSVLQTP